MIDPYFGEFLVNPVPLEMGLNYCSHGCSYCFANLNQRSRTANVKQIMALLSDYPNRKTLTAQLLRQGYPVLVSNRVDLLATSNAHVGLPIVRTMVELGIPLSFQTRGGRERDVDELIGMLDRPAVWYISVSELDDELRRRIEPGAPTVESRFALMERLAGLGHTVMLGANPLVREWQPDPRPLLHRARECGATGAWIERLHFHYRQVRTMTERERGAIGDEVITRAQKRRPDPDDMAHFMEARAHALDLGLEVYSIGQGCRSDFFTHYHRVYDKTFVTMQDFVNFCFDHDVTGSLIPFELFAQFMTPHLPQGIYPIDSYLGSVAHHLWWQYHVPPQMSYRQLLSIIWRDVTIKYNPARLPCFAYAARWDDGAADGQPGWIAYVDEHDLPYLVFNPDGFTDYYTNVDLPTDAEPVMITRSTEKTDAMKARAAAQKAGAA